MSSPADSVLLYSGGVDSYCLAQICTPDVLLYVDMDTAYGHVELARLRAPQGMWDRVVVDRLPLVGMERPDRIIPARNAYLVLLAANYGDTVLIGCTAADVIGDKDEEFARRMTHLLGHLYGPQWWLPEGRRVRLEMPAKAWTKRQLVGQYLAAGGDPDALAADTVACYETGPAAESVHCGRCKACVRKWAALVVHGIDPGYDARPALGDLLAVERPDRNPDERRDLVDAWTVTA